jgi:SAM-dependent methyltransferase
MTKVAGDETDPPDLALGMSAPPGLAGRLIRRVSRGPLRGLRSGATRRHEIRLALARVLSDLQRRSDESEARLAESEARLAESEARLAESEARLAESEARLAEAANELANLRGWLLATSNRGDEVAGRLEAALHDHSRDQLETHRELARIYPELAGIYRELARISELIAANVPLNRSGGLELESFDAGLGGTVVGFRDGKADVGDGVYLGFEGYFRGSEDEILGRQRAYLKLMRGRRRVLDVGCGRGEFLEIMRQAGINAAGIDVDPAMVRRCRDKGFDVVQADAVSYLESRPDRSFDAIFAAQVIEHLSYENLLLFLRASRDRLDLGGILILETVNPHAPQALKHFWIDPTHRNPLFPETILALCRLLGFGSAYVWHPQGKGDPEADRVEQLDYAVIAQAPPRRC